MTLEDKALNVINNYGIIAQLKYMSTEQFELNEAIIKYEHYKEQNKDCNRCEGYEQLYDLNCCRNHVEEEMADNLFMLLQIIEYYKLDIDKIKEIMNFKADRQLKRIEEEK